jgi:hypothetical protein
LDAFARKQFETTDMYSGQYRHRFCAIKRDDRGRGKVQTEIYLPTRDLFVLLCHRRSDIADHFETL